MASEQPDPKSVKPTMPDSDVPNCLLLPGDDKTEFEISKTPPRPMLEDDAKKQQRGPCEASTSPSSSVTEESAGSNNNNDNKVVDEDDDNNEDVDVVETDNDGFRTPTDPHHGIPVITQCPPAPRKTRTLRRKRKTLNAAVSSQKNASRKRIQIGLTEEEFHVLFSKAAGPDGAV